MGKENESTHHREYSIGEVSRRFGISLKTLRYYDYMGILKPSRRDSKTGYRYYDEDVTIRLCSIKYYQSMGLSLEEIRDFLFSENLEELIKRFESDMRTREEKINLDIMRRDAMAVWKDLLVEGKMILNSKDLPMGTRWLPKIETVFAYDGKSLLAGAVEVNQIPYGAIYVEYPYLQKRVSGQEQFFVRHMEVHPLTCRHIRTSEIGGFNAVTAIHIGNRDNIGQTYEKLLHWSEENDFKLGCSSLERYIIDETSLLREAEYVTEILIPLVEN